GLRARRPRAPPRPAGGRPVRRIARGWRRGAVGRWARRAQLERSPNMKHFAIGSTAEAGGARLLIIAGPCVVESADMCLEVAEHMKGACEARGLPYVFKASYRKANRSSARSFEGLGMEAALGILAQVKARAGVPILTDVHDNDEISLAAGVADVIQIPAFLSRQTGLIRAAARSGRAVNVKNGQFLAPDDMAQ